MHIKNKLSIITELLRIKPIDVKEVYMLFMINIKNRIFKIFKENNISFTESYIDIIGCTIEELETYFIHKFVDGMTFHNYGEWEVDHIIPVSSFDFSNYENINKCFHYSNLQSLWKKDNRTKFNKISVV